MVLKRQVGEGGEAESGLPNKRRHLHSTIFRGLSSARSLQDYLPSLEPIIRKWVKEEVDCSIDFYFRSSNGQTGSTRSRNLQLKFLNNLSHTIFTGNRIVSEDMSPIKLALCDSTSRKIVTTGPYSTLKVDTLVLDGDFTHDCEEDWLEKDFDSKVVQNRQGKRPLVIGEVTISLKDGIGYVGDISFTDNSSWTRSGKFRLGVKVHSGFGTNIREGISNSFKVKDQRGASNQKHYPPSLDDEVWRLVKIAKDGASHKLLVQFGISCVRDFLRTYNVNQLFLRDVLRNVSNKKWKSIIEHATTCILDDKKYIYRTTEGTWLLFNSIYKVVGVTFDGQSYHSIDNLNNYHLKMVEDMKQHAYNNLNNWEDFEVGPNISPHNANLHAEQDKLEMEINTHIPTISKSYFEVVEQNNSSFDLGESSQMQGLNLTFNNNFGLSDTSGRFYVGEQTWASGDNHMDS